MNDENKNTDMRNGKTEEDEFFSKLVGHAGTNSPSDGFTARIMQSIESGTSMNAQPVSKNNPANMPIIGPVAWLLLAFLGLAFVAVSYIPGFDKVADMNKWHLNIPRISDLFANLISIENYHLFAIVVIIASCLFMVDIALSRNKT